METKTCNILAPVCSLETLVPLLEAGADEVYFGIMPETWIKNYGTGDLLTRRQNQQAHFSSPDAMTEIANTVRKYGCKATLTLNARYSCKQLPLVYELIEQWENAGGHSLMVADMEILHRLNKQQSRLERHLSIMAGVFNSRSAAFFKRMNVSRIVLPRELSLEEFAGLSGDSEDKIDFEVIAMFQKCEFIDAFCNFYHAVNHRPYMIDNKGVTDVAGLPVITTGDRAFEGHGCRLPFRCKGVRIKHLENNDVRMPFCAACTLNFFVSHGIRHFKIAGRGYPNEMIVRAITFLRQTIESQSQHPDEIRSRYRQLFGHDCESKKCYYVSSQPSHPLPVRPVTVKHDCEPEKQNHAIPPDISQYHGRPVESACFLTVDQLTDKKILENTSFNRIYFGHETCERLLPAWNDITALLDIAQKQNIKLTFVSPFLTNVGMKRVMSLLEQIAATGNAIEVVTSDWGLLSRLMHACMGTPVVSRFLVGQQLDFRTKSMNNHYDPRILNIDGKYYRQEPLPPSAQMREHFSQCTLLKPETLDFLARHGVSRLELSNVYQTIKLPETDSFRYSLYVPFAPVTVFRNCPEQHDFNHIHATCSRNECCAGRHLWQTTSSSDSIVRRDNALYYRNNDLSKQLKENPLIDRVVFNDYIILNLF
ncbi:MAG: U32 family peptidase [Dysgonamonadaceae bacterium]|jgi:collagenase-like PrtC family protease|nr:U32 family peptidase [Dysgonamonadaceae bacterium]